MGLRDWFRLESMSTSSLRALLRVLENARALPSQRARIEIELWKREVDALLDEAMERAERERAGAYPVARVEGWN